MKMKRFDISSRDRATLIFEVQKECMKSNGSELHSKLAT